eukprot:3602760-Rhodomonas_salina.1
MYSPPSPLPLLSVYPLPLTTPLPPPVLSQPVLARESHARVTQLLLRCSTGRCAGGGCARGVRGAAGRRPSGGSDNAHDGAVSVAALACTRERAQARGSRNTFEREVERDRTRESCCGTARARRDPPL